MAIKSIYKSLTLIAASCIASMSFAGMDKSMHGNAVHMSISGQKVAQAIESLGLDAKQYSDKKGNPHFVISSPVKGSKSMAVFMDDCGKSGCEDVVLYSNFGKNNKVTEETMNEWNHIGSKLRSKMFRSDNDEVGISMAMSYYDDGEIDKVAMLIGLFVIETKWASDTLSQ